MHGFYSRAPSGRKESEFSPPAMAQPVQTHAASHPFPSLGGDLPDGKSSRGQVLCMSRASWGHYTVIPEPQLRCLCSGGLGFSAPSSVPRPPLLLHAGPPSTGTWEIHLPSRDSVFHSTRLVQSLRYELDLHYRVKQPPAHTGPRQIDFSGFVDVKGDILQ